MASQHGSPELTVHSSTSDTASGPATDVGSEPVTSQVVVVIDPEQIRCSDAFASTPAQVAELRCCTRPQCRPRDVTTVGDGVVRVAGEQSWWTIDIGAGRFVQSDHPLDVRFLGDDAWVALQGVWITAVKLTVATADGALVSGYRARAGERCTRRLAG